MIWNADTLAALLTEPESLEDLVAVLDDLTEADRSAIRKAIGKALPSLRRRIEKVGAGGQRLRWRSAPPPRNAPRSSPPGTSGG